MKMQDSKGRKVEVKDPTAVNRMKAQGWREVEAKRRTGTVQRSEGGEK